jgi:hypothetical protein
MQTEFYRSRAEFLPTFSLALAVSLAGLNTVIRSLPGGMGNGGGGSMMPALAGYPYYKLAERAPDPAEQAAALRRFAENLLAEVEDTPQAVVEVLNRHFWDLV